MSQVPKPYNRVNPFGAASSNNPSNPIQGSKLDNEFNAIEVSLDETQARLAQIQRDDGALANESVGFDQLTVDVGQAINSGAASAAASAAEAAASAAAAAVSTAFYVGAMAVAPTTRLNGSPLQEGDEYHNTVDHLRYNWNGSAWIALNSSAQSLETRLADFSATNKGAGLIGYQRRAPNAATRDTADFYLATKQVSIWEYEKYITAGNKPDTNAPDGWNWTQAFAQARLLGKRLVFTDGTFKTSITALAPGTQLEGEGAGRFSGARTIIQSMAAGEKLFTTVASASTGQRDALTLTGVRLVSDFPLTIGDPTVLIADGGASPYEMKAFVSECSMTPITTLNAGVGCMFAKVFDHVLEKTDITGFARNVVEIGSDLGSIRDNRIINFSEYGILQLSASTFGSQTELAHNDILGGGVGSIYIKTTARHARVWDNYLERSSGVTVAGFIDISTVSTPTYGPNVLPASVYYSVDVDLNRIDGEQYATSFIYRAEPIGYNVRIRGVGTTGVHNTIPWLTVVGDAVPMYSTVNTGNSVQLRHQFECSGERRWAAFKPEGLRMAEGSVAFNHLSVTALNPIELRRNNAFLHVFQNDHAILLKASLSTTLFHCILPTVTVNGVDTNNPWLRSGVSYTVTVMARMVSGTGSLRCLKIVDAASQGVALDTALTTQLQRITMTFTGVADTSKVGMAFAHLAGNTTDIEISSVTFKEV